MGANEWIHCILVKQLECVLLRSIFGFEGIVTFSLFGCV